MSGRPRLARAWLALVRRGQVRPEDQADVRALARAVAEHGEQQLTLGDVTFRAPRPEQLAGGGRIPIATRRSDRFELDPTDGSVWLQREGAEAQRAFDDLEDALSTYFEPGHDRSGLGDVLAAIDLWDAYFAPGAREAAARAAREAAAQGGVGFLPVADVPAATRDPALCPDGRLRLATHPVRTRTLDVASGAATTVLEGWWQLGAAWLPRGELCVLCSEGEVELDREDPEVCSLASVAGAGLPTERTIRVSSAGLLHVVSVEGEYRYQISVRAERVQSSPDGRWVALTRSSGAWRTAILAATTGGLVTVAKHPADIGTLVFQGQRAFGSSGFELLGVDAAVAAAPAGRVSAMVETLNLEQPPPPPPSTLKLDEPSPLSLERGTDAEPPPAPEPPDLQPNVGWPQVLSARREGDRCWVLARLFRAHAEILRFDLREGAWMRGPCVPVEGLDRLYVGARGRLLALTLDNAPPEMAWTVFLSVTASGELAHVGRLHHSITALWDDADGTHVKVLGGGTYTLRGLDDVLGGEARPLRAIVYDVKGHWGKRELLPRYDHDYGFIDTAGELAIEHQFTSAYDFEGGHTRAAHAGPRLFGLVDPDGGCFVPHHYNWIGPLVDGCRRIGRGEPDILGRAPEQATWGLLRHDGSVLLSPTERAVRDMCEGFAAVQLGDETWNLIDGDGRYLLSEAAAGCGDFGAGLCAVLHGELWGYVNREGRWAIEPHFREARAFREGVAVVVDGDRARFLNTAGQLSGSFDEASPHREGLARVRTGERWGFANTSGELVVAPRFDQAFDFHGGFAAVRVGDHWTWVDRAGRLLSEPRFDRAFNFHEGVGVFQDGPLRGYLRTNGEVLAEGFEAAYDFLEGRALVQQRARWGFIDAAGELVIAPQFAGALGFSEGLAAVRSAGAWGYIDRDGTIVLPPRFVECGSFHQGRARVRRAA